MNLSTIQQKAIPIFKKFGVEKAAIFGSYARHAQTEDSDIDFLIEYSVDAKRSLFKRVELKHQLEDALGKKVDVVTVKALSPFIKDDVLKEKRDIL